MRSLHNRSVVGLLLAVVVLAAHAQPYRYLRFSVLEADGEKIQELDWYAGGAVHPTPHMTSTTSNGMTLWGDNAGWELVRIYDGDPTTHAWIGDIAPPYRHEFYLDLGSGNGIVPDSVMITKPSRTRLKHFQCWVSTDGVGWDLFLDTVLASPQFTQDAFPLALVADTEPPTAPANLVAANITDKSAALYWEEATDNRLVDEYRIFRDDVQIGSSKTNSYLDEGLSPATTYALYVVAADRAGNTSSPSNTVTVVTPATDLTPPQAPTGVQANAVSDSRVDIAWTASASGSEVVGYVVYLDGNPAGCAEETHFSIPGLDPSTQYEITVRARDAAGNASTPSAAAQVTTPSAGTPTMIMSTNFWDVGWGGGSADPFREGFEAVSGVNPWNLDLLNELEPYQTLRFMDWDKTNGSPVSHWMERTPMDSLIQRPVAYEWMMNICNRLDKHM
ncbi:MAG: hypothetical protein GF331_14240, partial [Chitinivibrionales bacterium]|nr:hypothetical protein [Chitinivibrionales bacterium]